MNISRREFIQMLAVAGVSTLQLEGCSTNNGNRFMTSGNNPADLYELPAFGNVSIMHYTDCHAQLMPIHFREPNINLGIGSMRGQPPHLVGENLLKHYGIRPGSAEANALTYIDFTEASKKFGKVGGFAHLSSLVKKIRAQRPNSLLLDGGDTWQGSATALWTNAQDMVDAQLLLGVDIMTSHWEMTFGAERVQEIINNDFKGKIDFVAQNVVDNNWGDPIFKPYVIRNINGIPTAIIGQAFPYTPIANPRYMIPDWSFGIQDENMQAMVNKARGEGAQVVVVLSHNGMDVDLKMASRVTGIDAIMGGHTHDAIPSPTIVNNLGGKTLVTNAGSNGKFLAVLDFDVKNGRVRDFRYKLLPVFSNLIEADPEMEAYINKVRAPYLDNLQRELAITDSLLYRRGNFNGTFDQLICDALIEVMDAPISLSPGFRWGVSVLPGEPITFEQVMSQTAITYPTVSVDMVTGGRIKEVLEDVADNLFNIDPYYQQGGDMVRVGGLRYSINPHKKIGQRINDMELNGQALMPNKEYPVAGWASVGRPLEGRPVWDVVEEYLTSKKTIRIDHLNTPKIIGVKGNPGYKP
ncbi:MAG: thiosulfohydrolase SoxB [Gammaproteobacteria bacterium]|nr:thiosulfohydrolase SoxB [Gammaproteobacteria bacterium]